MSVPKLTQLLQLNADDTYTTEISKRNWHGLAEKLGYSIKTIAATTPVATMGYPETMPIAVKTTTMNVIIGITVLLTTALIAMNIYIGGRFQYAPQPGIRQPYAQGQIIFSGGNTSRTTVNPTQAVINITNEYGALMPRHWWITVSGSEEIIYSGEGGNVDETLAMMNARGESGEYMLNFFLEDAAGNEYRVKRQFTIQP